VPAPTRSAPPTDEARPSDEARPTEEATPDEDAAKPRSPGTEEPGGDKQTVEPTPAEAEATTTAVKVTAEDEGGSSPWVWWLLAALAVGAVAAVTALVVRTRGKHRWLEELRTVVDEVGWFAHELLPELLRSTTLDQVVGGWNVASGRVGAAEDRLTALEASAPTDADQARARTLRDAVRRARQRLDSLALVAPHDTWALDLDDVMDDLETALVPSATPPGHTPQG
jgi:hypothetical protein